MSNEQVIENDPGIQFPVSRLHHLDPIGIGTEEVESFTDYLTALAQSHSLLLRDLLVAEVLPCLGPSATYTNAQNGRPQLTARWWRSCSPALNGLHASARAWVTVIENLTLQRSLHSLTMLPWADVLSFRGLVRREKAWCEYCFEEQRISGQVVYEPLLWSLEAVRVCHRHKTLLRDRCPFPACGKAIPFLTSDMTTGFCPHCNRWLGSDFDPKRAPQTVAPDDLEAQLNVVKAVGEMLAVVPHLEKFPTRDQFASAVSNFITDKLDGNIAEAARQMQVSRRTVMDWSNGTQSPELGILLKICDAMDRSPVELLTGVERGRSTRIDFSYGSREKKPKRKPREFLEGLIRTRLTDIIENGEVPPPSLREVARRLKYDVTFLRKRIPDLSQIIVDRHKQFTDEQKDLRTARLRELVRERAYQLHQQGIYPSLHQVAVGDPDAALEDIVVWPYWKEVLAELGYTD